MKRHDIISSLFCLFFALLICIESIRTLPLGSLHNPGPGFLPLVSGITLGLLSGISYLRALFAKSEEVKGLWYSKERWKNLVLILAALFAYASFLEIIGFLVSTFCLLFFLFRTFEPMKWSLVIGGSAAASFALYALFDLWLKVQLPRGILGF